MTTPRLNAVSPELPPPPYREDATGRARLLANGFPFELEVGRMHNADSWVLCPPEIRPWMVMSWLTSWAQHPCGSLPGEDELIAARLGCTLAFFTAQRLHILRGWVLHADGRYYHPVITAQVLKMLAKRDGWRSRQGRRRGESPETVAPGEDDVTRDTPVTHAGVTVESQQCHAPSSSSSSSSSEFVEVAKATVEFAQGEPDLARSKAAPPTPEARAAPPVPRPDTPPVPAAVGEVFQHWQAVMRHPQARLDVKRRKAIGARLKEGYSVDQLKQAIEGCKASPWHQGQNDRHLVYDDIGLICRDAQRVEAFIARVAGQTAQQAELDAWVNEGACIEGECRHVHG